ncbi:putative Actin family, ATPase, nucleotide binding domain-containing protein [Helianthus annuus]|nr:putative Actin family, ATPase, nucleotide binding domain-containing protein [Helianthus annuus]
MDYSKSVIPSHLFGDRGSILVVINPRSANIRIGLAQQDAPFNIPHCIARRMTTGANESPRRNLQDQVDKDLQLTKQIYIDQIVSLLKIPFLDEEVVNNSHPRKMGRVDVLSQQNSKKETVSVDRCVPNKLKVKRHLRHQVTKQSSSREHETIESPGPHESNDGDKPQTSELKYTEYICGEEAIRISPTEPYCLRRPIRRGHLNISQYYPMQQEGLAAVFGNGLSTACVVNIGAQVTSVICVEDGVPLPQYTNDVTFWRRGCIKMPFVDSKTSSDMAAAKPIDLLMLNRLKESYCQIYEGEVEAVGVVHSYEDGLPPGSHRTRLTALNVAPMGLFYPTLLVPDVYPPPPHWWSRFDSGSYFGCGGEVLQSRTNPLFVAWRGGAILGVIDYGRDAWIHREDWIKNGIHIAGGRKYKDSYYLQAQPMCYINS